MELDLGEFRAVSTIFSSALVFFLDLSLSLP
jgi:hypothetical protein